MLLNGLGQIYLRQDAGLLKVSSCILLLQSRRLLPIVHGAAFVATVRRVSVRSLLEARIFRAKKRNIQTSSPIDVAYKGRAISTLHGEDSAGSQSRMEVMTSFIVNISWVTRTHGSVVAVLQIGMA